MPLVEPCSRPEINHRISADRLLPPESRNGAADMRHGRELEIKFKTNAAGLKLAMASKLLACEAPEAPIQTLRSIYFDTAAGDLKKERITLRTRKTGHGAPQMGLKWTPTSEGLFSRGEVEVRAPSTQPDISLFDAHVAAEIERVTEGRPLEPQFETVVERRLRRIRLSQSMIEVAFDEGAVVAGDRRLPISEIELEFKSGEEFELYELAIRLVEDLPLSLDVASKAERGFMLASGEPPQPVTASAPHFSADAALNEAVMTIITSAITPFAANWPAVTLHESVRLPRFRRAAAGNGETKKPLRLVFAANMRLTDGRRRAA